MDEIIITPSKCSAKTIKVLNEKGFTSKDEPTLDGVVTWLRNKYNVHVYAYSPTKGLWGWRAQLLNKNDEPDHLKAYAEIAASPDDALNEGICFSLRNLAIENKEHIKIPKKGFDESIYIHDVFAALNLKIGDVVEVVYKPTKDCNGWRTVWDPAMDKMVGKKFYVESTNPSTGVKLGKWWFPPHCLAKV